MTLMQVSDAIEELDRMGVGRINKGALHKFRSEDVEMTRERVR